MSMYNEPVITEKDQEEDSINLKQIFFKYLSYWKWIVVSVVLFIILAFLYTKITTPIFEVKSSILIKSRDKASPTNDIMSQLNLFSGAKETDNEVEIFKSYTLMERVVKDLNLTARYYTREGLRKRELYKDSPIKVEIITPNDSLFKEPLKMRILEGNKIQIDENTYSFNTPIYDFKGAFKVIANDSILKSWDKDDKITVYLSSIKSAVRQIQNDLTVETPTKGKSTVLYLNLMAAEPAMGVDILTDLILKYNEANIEDKNTVAKNTLEFIEDRIKLISVELGDAERTVERFKSTHGITDIGTESKLFLESVQTKDAELSRVNIQLNVLKNIERYVLNKNNNTTSAPATLGIEDPTLLELIKQLTTLETERAKALQTVPASNPLIIAMDEPIENLKRSIYSNIQVLKQSLEITKRNIQQDNARLEYIIKSVPQKERELVDVTRQQAIKNELYMFLLSKKEEAALSYASTVSDSRVIDYPISSEGPVKPVKRNIFLIFFILGLIAPIGVIYIRDLIYNKIADRSDVRKATTIPIIGEISFLENKTAPISINQDVRNKQAEQIRTLRTNLQFMGNGNSQCILFTSNTSGEGKSFTSLNLGASLALTGKKTVILGFDMRRPQLQKELELKNTTGLSSYLSGQTELDKITFPIQNFSNYFIIPSGPIPPNPIELMMNERMDSLFKELREKYDYIVMDSPPVGLVSDALILEKHADITLYIVRHDYTPKESIKQIDDLYRDKRFKNLGIIINGVKDDSMFYGYKRAGSYYE